MVRGLGRELDPMTVRIIERSRAVDHVDVAHQMIHYKPWFRKWVMRRYRMGDRPVDLFRLKGIGPELIGWKRIERCIRRWRDGGY
ncbi:hypothetical protein [Bifidobacterium felsineum]|uniref:hypothetical protein n=1 Tax=Bifidobacterium felsineum TaxID=2045440 RepID=UPI001BDD4B0F|nr:hypothetical protein [Bifidobacterium felsineum]MBT1164582.1 hypothetical protein [Bifidobacterium felsineum]